MVEGGKWLRREGLDGAEVAKRGWRNVELKEALQRDSKSAFRFELLGEERGGVTGALLEILRGGRFVGIEVMLRMNGRRKEEGFVIPSMRVGLVGYDGIGLGNEEDCGLGNEEDCGLGCIEEQALIFVGVPPISFGNGLLLPFR